MFKGLSVAQKIEYLEEITLHIETKLRNPEKIGLSGYI